MSTFVPFNRPFVTGKELDYIEQALRSGHLSGGGQFTRCCSTWLETRFQAQKALLTHSCTAALEMAALLTEVGPGDEVIMPSFTFVSTANAFALRGASIRFVDIRPDTLNLDERKIEQAITPRTKVIVAVHYAGVGCEMDLIQEIAASYHLFVVEDAAQGVNSSYKGKYLGTMGQLGCYSFHETKNFISGEGGALMINDPRLIQRAEIIWEKGTNRSRFIRGDVDRYTWIDIGSSYLPSELVAAFLYAQLEQADKITTCRHAVYARYACGLKPLADRGILRLPYTPGECTHNAHMFYILVKDQTTRRRIIEYLNENSIRSVFHYVPLHTAPMGLKCGSAAGALPVTEDVSERLVRLPCFYELHPEDQDRTIACIFRFFDQADGSHAPGVPSS